MLKTFKIGGVHPPENKLSSGQKIVRLPLPERVIIPLGQHIGAPASPIVEKGEKVKTGQLIAKAEGFVSSNVHSSVSGTVLGVEQFTDASGFSKPGIAIQVEGDEWIEQFDSSEKVEHNIIQNKEEILKAIADAGIVGLGGATFPTQVKLSPPPGTKAETLVINAVECEPYLTSDHRIMLERTEEIIIGIRILMKALQVDKAIVGIENNKKDAIEKMRQYSAKTSGIEIAALKVKYPQGGEKQLINAVMKRSVPSGGLPIAVGAVVQNVSTALAVYEAVMKHKPLIERVVTITGKSVKNPGNYICRVGTPLTQLIEAAGGLPDDTCKVVGGGPMMGRAIVNPESPVIKGTGGILIINEKEGKRKASRNCIRCSKCVTVCPMGLEPYQLMTLAQNNMLEELEKEKVMDCIECGSCSFTCPATRPILDYVRLGKTRTGNMIRNRKK